MAEEPARIDVAGQTEIAGLPGQASFIYMPEDEETPINPHTGWTANITFERAVSLIGSANEYTFWQVVNELEPKEGGYVDHDYLLGPFWMRVQLHNSGVALEHWRLDFRTTNGPPIKVYLRDADGARRLILADRWNETTTFERFPHTRLLASEEFGIPAGGTVELWVDAEDGLLNGAFGRLVQEAQFVRDRQNDVSFSAFVFGLRTALLFALLAFAFVLRDRTALYYSGFHGGMLLAALSNYNFVGFYFDINGEPAGIVVRILLAFAFVCYALTIRSFLDAPQRYKTYDRVLISSVAFGLAVIPILSWFGESTIYSKYRPLVEGGAELLFAAITTFGVARGLKDRLPGAGLFLLGALMLVALGVMHMLSTFDMVALSSQQISDGVHVLFALDGVIFAAALVARAIAIRRQRDEALEAHIAALAERAELAEQLTEARRAHLEAVNLAEKRRRDLATTSHDLKQPLLSLQMALKKIEGGDAAAEGLSYMEDVLRRNLEGARPDQGALRSASTEAGLPLSKALGNVVLMFGDEAQDRGIALDCPMTNVIVHADPVSLMRIVSNLVSNAINHSGAKRISIGAKEADGGIQLVVSDDGRGFSEEEAAHAFDAYQAGASSKGEGLGLSVVKELAEAQGWTITLQSMPGAGATFTIGGISAK